VYVGLYSTRNLDVFLSVRQLVVLRNHLHFKYDAGDNIFLPRNERYSSRRKISCLIKIVVVTMTYKLYLGAVMINGVRIL
jgi:hypothetical protein